MSIGGLALNYILQRLLPRKPLSIVFGPGQPFSRRFKASRSRQITSFTRSHVPEGTTGGFCECVTHLDNPHHVSSSHGDHLIYRRVLAPGP